MDSDADGEIVTFAHNDPENPMNWSMRRKASTQIMSSSFAFAAAFGSSIWSPGISEVEADFHISKDLATLGLSLFVLGFGVGPIVFAPWSEAVGRKVPYIVSLFLYAVFTIPSCWNLNPAIVIFFRFLAGSSASCCLNNGSAVISDLYAGKQRLRALAWYSTCAFAAPVFSPVIGAFVAGHVGWQWNLRILLFFIIGLIPIALIFPETYGPAILSQRARRLRRETGNKAIRARHELVRPTLRDFLYKVFGRPVVMLTSEPIAMATALWLGLLYGILYLFFVAFPVIYVQQHDIPPDLAGLPFLGVGLGIFISALTIHHVQDFFLRVKLPFLEAPPASTSEAGVSPEDKLRVSLPAVAVVPISLFWCAWTSGSEVHFLVPAFSGVLFGIGYITNFIVFVNYTADTYTVYTGSAMAANTVCRCIIAASLPIAGNHLFANLGTEWGLSIIAFATLVVCPLPFGLSTVGSMAAIPIKNERGGP